jgi:Mg2+/Co2+ transporter CorB
MTVLILVVSEIIPKTIGTTYWQGLWNFYQSLVGMVAVLKYTGILWVLQLTTKAIGHV